jgi:CDP-diacylglycerol pyrophosphatase
LTKLPLLLLVLAGLAALPAGADSEKHGSKSKDLPPDPGRDALRQVVQEQCVVNWTQKQDPSPCERVFLADAKSGKSGYAVLADRKGGAHYLLVPVQTFTGLEGAELLDPDTPNFFAQAWHARDYIAKFVGHDVPRNVIGLAVNKARARTQDQFHVHIECLRQEVVASLRNSAEQITEHWSPVSVDGFRYDALRIAGDGLDGANPFELLAASQPDARSHMADYTFVVAGMQYKSGPGFVLLAGTGPTGELLLDPGCAAAGGGG